MPALFIATEIKKLNPDSVIEFIGSGRPLEEKIIGGAGFKINKLSIVGLSRRGLLGKIEFFCKLPKSFLETIRLFKKFKPDAVLGVGGYISALPVLWGSISGCHTVIHEAEEHPGLANKFLSFFAKVATCAYENVKFPGKIAKVYTDQPLNPDIYKIPQLKAGEQHSNILILGGSQGSEAIDQGIIHILSEVKPYNFNFIHQCRAENLETLRKKYKDQAYSAELKTFIDDMPRAYEWSHIIIARSGANTVREVEVIGRPAIFIPLPEAPEQLNNAKRLAAKGQALIVEQDHAYYADLLKALVKLCKNGNFNAMSRHAVSCSETPAVKIAKVVLAKD